MEWSDHGGCAEKRETAAIPEQPLHGRLGRVYRMERSTRRRDLNWDLLRLYRIYSVHNVCHYPLPFRFSLGNKEFLSRCSLFFFPPQGPSNRSSRRFHTSRSLATSFPLVFANATMIQYTSGCTLTSPGKSIKLSKSASRRLSVHGDWLDRARRRSEKLASALGGGAGVGRSEGGTEDSRAEGRQGEDGGAGGAEGWRG